MRSLMISVVLLLMLPLVGHGTYNMPFSPRGGTFCSTSTATWCEDFEEAKNCNLLANTWSVSGGPETDCNNTTSPIGGSGVDLAMSDDDTSDLVVFDNPTCATTESNCEYRWQSIVTAKDSNASYAHQVLVRTEGSANLCIVQYISSTSRYRLLSRTATSADNGLASGVLRNFCLQVDLEGASRGCHIMVDTGSNWCQGLSMDRSILDTEDAAATGEIVFTNTVGHTDVQYDNVEVFPGGGP